MSKFLLAILGAIIFGLQSLGAGPLAGGNLMEASLDYARRYPEPEFLRFVYGVEEAAVLNYTLNLLSSQRAISHAEPLGGGLYAFDLRQFAHDADVWATKWRELEENHVYTKVKSQVVREGKTVLQVVPGVWVSGEEASALEGLTGAGPLRFDYFLNFALSEDYYDFAAIPQNIADWFALGGIDLDTAKRLGARNGANILISGVTGKTRRIIRLGSLLGGNWSTFDSAIEAPERDHSRTPISADGSFRLDFDAGEYIQHSPNGLAKYALYDSGGERAETVPDAIAKDTSDPHGDGILRPAISCIRCHSGMLIPFVDDYQALGLKVAGDSELEFAARNFYDSGRLQFDVTRDVETFEKATFEATGMQVSAVTAKLSEVYRKYRYLPVTLDVALLEVGASEPEKSAKLFRSSSDPILVALALGRAVSRKQWEASFSSAMVIKE